jgi:hypothetical protein
VDRAPCSAAGSLDLWRASFWGVDGVLQMSMQPVARVSWRGARDGVDAFAVAGTAMGGFQAASLLLMGRTSSMDLLCFRRAEVDGATACSDRRQP